MGNKSAVPAPPPLASRKWAIFMTVLSLLLAAYQYLDTIKVCTALLYITHAHLKRNPPHLGPLVHHGFGALGCIEQRCYFVIS